MRIRQSGPISSTTNRWDGQVPAGRCPHVRQAIAMPASVTTVFDAAVAPLTARLSHAELDDIVDAGFFVLMGNDDYLFRLIDAGEGLPPETMRHGCWGGGRLCHQGGESRRHRAVEAGTPRPRRARYACRIQPRDPRAILETLVGAANELRLPHAAHVHCNNLGVTGNVSTTLDSMRAVDGHRRISPHLQFHSYGVDPEGRWVLGRARDRRTSTLIPTLPATSGGSCLARDDADGRWSRRVLLHKSSGRMVINVDIELETGCGIVPAAEKAAIAALQWAVGLELFLLSSDPWRVVLSTDHPNGGSFMACQG